jgi:hypothetical protein
MKEKKMRDNYKVCYHWYVGVLKMTPLLSTETEENGQSSVNINNDSSVYDSTKKGKIITYSLLSFCTNSNNIVKFSVHSNLNCSDVSTTVTNVLTL